MFPPALMRVGWKRQAVSPRWALWVPLILLWLLLLPLVVLTLVVLAIAAAIAWPWGYGRPLLSSVPYAWSVLCALRGLQIEVEDEGRGFSVKLF